MARSLIIAKQKNEQQILTFLAEKGCCVDAIIYGRGAYKGLLDFAEHKRALIFFNNIKEKEVRDFVINDLQFEKENTGIMITFKGGNMKKNYQLVVTIINSGFSDIVMNKARECGVKGGTIVNARGTGTQQATFMGMAIDSEKEIVLNVVEDEIASKVVGELSKFIKEDEKVSGISFALPISKYVGINLDNTKK